MEIQTLIKIPQTIKNLKRVREILTVLSTHGFGDIVTRLNLVEKFPALKKVISESRITVEELHPNIRIRKIFEELGPTFIKLGQVLATRPDIIPMDLIQELRKLQDDVSPFPVENIRDLVENAIEMNFDEAFESIDSKPLAAASIAQVHKAKLKTGEDVVLKIQRPNLDHIIATDIEILSWLANLIEEQLPEFQNYDPRGMVKQFSVAIKKETNFVNEAKNLLRFASNFEEETNFKVPTPYMEYTAKTVLTMEFINGVKIDEAETLDNWGVDRSHIASYGTNIILRSIFDHGFFHADPHPGNIFIMEDGKICLIDYGMMGEIDQERINEILVFLVSILTCDTEMMVNLFVELGLITEDVDTRGLKIELRSIILRYTNVSLGKLDITEFLTEVFEVIINNQIKLPSDLLMIGKSLATVEGIAQTLNPSYDPIGELRPYLISTYIKNNLDPKRRARSLMRILSDYKLLAKQFPKDLRGILTRIKKGELKVNVDSQDMRILADSKKYQSRLLSSTMLSIFGLSLATFLLYHPYGPLIAGYSMSSILGLLVYFITLPLLSKSLLEIFKS